MRLLAIFVCLYAYTKSLDCVEENKTQVNYFDVDLLRYSAEYNTGNVMVSPASIRTILATILEGTNASTADEIKTVLRLLPDSPEVREELKTVIQGVSEVDVPGVILENSNALFMSKWLTLRDKFSRESTIGSNVYQVDFSDPVNTVVSMNRWVNANTKGYINEIVNQANITPATHLVVVNTMYFKSKWRIQFPKKYIHSDCFYKNGQCKTVSMMDIQTHLNYTYVESLRAHVVELPYQNSRYVMLLLVPQDQHGCLAVLRDLAYVGLKTVIDDLKPAHVYVSLPKFTISFRKDMVPVLKAMGIKTLFTPAANLSRLFYETDSKVKPHFNSIFHSVFMDVDEDGAAATSNNTPPVPPLSAHQVHVRVDRPFVFFVLDTKLRIVLLEAMVEEPTEHSLLGRSQPDPGTIIKQNPEPARVPKRSVPTTRNSNKPKKGANMSRTRNATVRKGPTKRSNNQEPSVLQKIAGWLSFFG